MESGKLKVENALRQAQDNKAVISNEVRDLSFRFAFIRDDN